MKRAFAFLIVLGAVGCLGAFGAPIGDVVRGVAVLALFAALLSSMVGGARLAGECFAAALVLLLASVAVDGLAHGTRALLSHWQTWVALTGFGCVAFAIGATVLVTRAAFAHLPTREVPRMPRGQRAPFVEPLDEMPPWGEENPTRSRREDRDDDETGVFGFGERR